MGKNKIARFEENLTFPNLFQRTFEDLQQNGFELKGHWHQDFFKNSNPITLELGCGKGEYTVGLAKEYPNRNFIGMDIKGARLWRGCKTSNEEKMGNVAFIRTHIQHIQHFYAPNEVDEIWVTFPDPQLRNCKAQKRLTSQYFLSLYKNILKKDGIIHLKTDSKELYDFTLEVIAEDKHRLLFASDDVYNSGVEEAVTRIQTFYESMFTAMGKKITYIRFQLNPEL